MVLVHRKAWGNRSFDFAGAFAVAFLLNLFRAARAGPLENHAAWSYDSCPAHSTVPLQSQHMSHRRQAMGYARNSTFKKRYLLLWRTGREMPPAFGYLPARAGDRPIHGSPRFIFGLCHSPLSSRLRLIPVGSVNCAQLVVQLEWTEFKFMLARLEY